MKKNKISSEEADGARLYKKLRKQQASQIAVELPSGAIAHVSPAASPELLGALDKMATLAAAAVKENTLPENPEVNFWKAQHETIRRERENSFEMLRKTVGSVGCTASQPEVDLEIDSRIRQIIWERDQFLDETPITRDWLISVGFSEVASDMGPTYGKHLEIDRLNLWEFNGTGEWLLNQCDSISFYTRGDVRCMAHIMKIELKEPS